jgi:NADPH-dependent 2,4-dienoyl-CoA reductase/sulfur reductase-like enzyme/rhodanese-related sulfurtransferase/two-component sensor histidine kinase
MSNKKQDLEHISTSDNLIRVLSHQLKSPINSIESLLMVIAEGFTGELDAKTLHMIKKAIIKTGEARNLITDLINYEKYSKSSQSIKKQETEVCAQLTTITNTFQTAAADKNISLSLKLPKKMKIFTETDRAGFELVLKNIIDNALKYTPEGGKVTVSLTILEKEKFIRIDVSDTGYGIPENEFPFIFDPFFRSPSFKAHVSGTGLGLSLVKRIINTHNGEIQVESHINKGSVFSITLPYKKYETDRKIHAKQKKIVIIGGVTAGPKAAARLRRLDETLDITIIEKSEFLSYAGCGLPSYLSGRVSSPKALMSSADNTLRDLHFFEHIKNININNNTEAIDIDRTRKLVKTKNLKTKSVSEIPYDVLILATGAKAVIPRIPGIKSKGVYSLYRFEDAEELKRVFAAQHASDVYIIGGGLIGVETAESLISIGARITILERESCILNLFDPDISEKLQHELDRKGIKTITNILIKKISHDDDKHTIITNKGSFQADIIILSAGVRPNADLGAKAGLEIAENGAVKINEYLQTSDRSIYAIGDCSSCSNIITKKCTYLPLGSVSTKMGRVAADNICGKKTKFPGSLGTVMFKIFDISVARTGLHSKRAKQYGFQTVSMVVSGLDKTHYYETAKHVFLKIIADKKTNIILGAQGYGKGNIAERIELLACAINRQTTLDEIFMIDLGYYPAFNNPIDIIQTACLVLKNKIEKLCRTISILELKGERDSVKLIDVSPVTEHISASIPGSINIPLENLRVERIPFKKKDKIVLYSKTSSRAYEAFRYLSTLGFSHMRILEGGYLYWKD